MTGTYRLVLVLVVLAVSRACHAIDDIWAQLGDLPEVVREYQQVRNIPEPGQSLHPQPANHDPGHSRLFQDAPGHFQAGQNSLAHFSGQHLGPSSAASVPYETSHTPSSSRAGQVTQIAEIHSQSFPADDPIIVDFDTATGQPKHPRPLTVQQRKEILKPIAEKSWRTRPSLVKSKFQAFNSERLTPELIGDAYFARHAMYRHVHGTGIYVTSAHGPYERSKRIALYHGGMETTMDLDHQLHVWRRFSIAGQPGSVLQYIGKVEPGLTHTTVTRPFSSYKTEKFWKLLGPDSIYDSAPFELINLKSKVTA
ncbi:uncharacterized protein MEPE_04280 [Melanopsichium pennsylvanicum]|uniref:Effector family protein Eff1 n=1 Tax=Melanopsichium pennsylvanicum TaxID=63383 RepID=A0AAJ4XPJ9_9BASI|nr:uncharacterized protein MEPE_04280 [Melanopsichium pennsylvanicum]